MDPRTWGRLPTLIVLIVLAGIIAVLAFRLVQQEEAEPQAATGQQAQEGQGAQDEATPVTPATVQIGGNEALGTFLVDREGMTLYTWDRDAVGMSNCTDECISDWPPLLEQTRNEPTADPDVRGAIDLIERDDGALQVTYDGMPLYRYAEDTEPGDANGHGVNDTWHVARP